MRKGQKFAHNNFIVGSPKAGNARADICTITKITQSIVYYRSESGMLISAQRSKFEELYGSFLTD
jgi:hypothetical protein